MPRLYGESECFDMDSKEPLMPNVKYEELAFDVTQDFIKNEREVSSLLAKLWSLANTSWEPTNLELRGVRTCEFNGLNSMCGRPDFEHKLGGKICLGQRRVFLVHSERRAIFLMPLIYIHYVEKHNYHLDQAVAESVMACPAMDTCLYYRKLLSLITEVSLIYRPALLQLGEILAIDQGFPRRLDVVNWGIDREQAFRNGITDGPTVMQRFEAVLKCICEMEILGDWEEPFDHIAFATWRDDFIDTVRFADKCLAEVTKW